MKSHWMLAMIGLFALLLSASMGSAQDWPQWRGPHRDATVSDFKAPSTWPKDLKQQWQVTVGDGVATPALVGDKLYVFARQNGKEVTHCLDAGTGKEIWHDEYPAEGATGPAAGFAGPRSSPTVADGKVVTFGVRGMLSCLDAATGKVLWRKDTNSWPRFFTSSSPIIADGLCIAQIGGQSHGAVVAYDLATGDEKWRWTGDGSAYASPVLLHTDGTTAVIAETDQRIVALGVQDGKLLWQTPFAVPGRGYNSATPIAEGSDLIYAGSGRGTHEVKLDKQGADLKSKQLWSNKADSVMFSTPVEHDRQLYGISDRDVLFCINVRDGKTAWTSPLPSSSPAGGTGGRGRGRGRQGYGSIVSAGPVLFALTPAAQLIVFKPSAEKFEELATYKVSDSPTYAYPVISGARIYIKDKDSVILWTLE